MRFGGYHSGWQGLGLGNCRSDVGGGRGGTGGRPRPPFGANPWMGLVPRALGSKGGTGMQPSHVASKHTTRPNEGPADWRGDVGCTAGGCRKRGNKKAYSIQCSQEVSHLSANWA